MLLAAGKTVADIAAGNPQAVRVFEKYRIDYCCGGQRPLEDACREKNLSPQELLREIETAAASPADRDWAAEPLALLIDHIVGRHHAYLRAELPALTGRLGKVLQAHAAKHGDSLVPLRITFEGLKNELLNHMFKEEMVLFPLIKRMESAQRSHAPMPPAPGGSVNNPIRMMEHEHDDAAIALREMRRLTADYTPPPDACNTYRALLDGLAALEADLHVHIHLENNILFPRAAGLEMAEAPRY